MTAEPTAVAAPLPIHTENRLQLECPHPAITFSCGVIVSLYPAMKSLCSLNMNSTKLSADTYEDLKVSPPCFPSLAIPSLSCYLFPPPPFWPSLPHWLPLEKLLWHKGWYTRSR